MPMSALFLSIGFLILAVTHTLYGDVDFEVGGKYKNIPTKSSLKSRVAAV